MLSRSRSLTNTNDKHTGPTPHDPATETLEEKASVKNGDAEYETGVFAVSPDGKTIASGTGDGFVRLWDAGATLSPLPVRSKLTRPLLRQRPWKGRNRHIRIELEGLFLRSPSRLMARRSMGWAEAGQSSASMQVPADSQRQHRRLQSHHSLTRAPAPLESETLEMDFELDPGQAGAHSKLSSLSIAPDGKLLATGAIGSASKGVTIWNLGPLLWPTSRTTSLSVNVT